jgi:PAS domain-containing protein
MSQQPFDINKIENSPFCISVYNQKLDVLLWNRSCEDYFRIKKDDILGKGLLSAFPFIEDDYRTQCLRKAFEGRTYFFNKVPYRFARGTYTQYIGPFETEENKVQSVINIVQDLTPGKEPFTREQMLESIGDQPYVLR